MKWDPQKYIEFGDLRSRPFFDLTARIDALAPRKVVDLGCGPGNLTAALSERWTEAEVLGIDSSQEMITRAEKTIHTSSSTGELLFEREDISAWQGAGEAEVVITNAALQWVPGHQDLMRSWLAQMPRKSWFAMQVPGNFDAPSHALMRELAQSKQWNKILGDLLLTNQDVGEPEDYLSIALSSDFRADVWETNYYQLLQGPTPVLDWVRGTTLRPVSEKLREIDSSLSLLGEFENQYQALLEKAYPATQHGTVFPFRRIFLVAQKR